MSKCECRMQRARSGFVIGNEAIAHGENCLFGAEMEVAYQIGAERSQLRAGVGYGLRRG